MSTISAARVVVPHGVLEPGWVEVRDGRIVGVGEGPPGPTDEQLPGQWLVPGFVDVHVHGGDGAAYPSGDRVEAGRAMRFHRHHGTTTTVASLVTAPLHELVGAVQRLADGMDDADAGASLTPGLAGLHLEGPFLSPARCGAHLPALLRSPTRHDLAALLSAGRGRVRMVTLAPELDGGLDAVRQVVASGAIAAVGHTDATYAVTRAALDAGATVATHLFNGLPPVHHREPGPVPAVLEDPRVFLEIIADGVHLHPAMIRLTVDIAGPDRVALVSDATPAAGLGDGLHQLGAQQIRVDGGVARVVGSGSLAGSTLTMASALRYAVHGVGLPLPAAVTMASTTPARLLGVADRVGSIAPGRDADLVVLDAALGVERVMAKGVWVR